MVRLSLCPQCKKPIDVDPNPFRPFCSDRCQKIDLGKWFHESYRIPDEEKKSEEVDKDEEES